MTLSMVLIEREEKKQEEEGCMGEGRDRRVGSEFLALIYVRWLLG